MERMMAEIVAFWAYHRPMSPAASHFMIALMMFTLVAIPFMVRETVDIIRLSICNTKIVGVVGVLYAIIGLKVRKPILREKVISVSRRKAEGRDDVVCYHVTTSNGERQGSCFVVPVNTDTTIEFDLAERLKYGRPDLYDEICPSRLREEHVTLSNEDGDECEIFTMFMRHDDIGEVQDLLQKEFDRRYEDAKFHEKFHRWAA